jgi:hypothetical protein
MEALLPKTKAIRFAPVFLFFLQGAPFSMAQPKAEVRVENVRFEAFAERIDVYYDFTGSEDEDYEVTLSLRKETDTLFVYKPKALAGDVGVGRFAGKNKRILWDLRKEFPKGLEGSDYYFVVSAKLVSKGSSALLWIGAAVVLGGGAAAYFLLAKKKTEEPEASLPSPPGRPR